MNKKLILAFALIGMIFASSCNKEDKGPAPTDIDAATLTQTPVVGGVKLQWKIPEGANYKYVRVDYTIPETVITETNVFKEEHRTRLASIYSNEKKVVDGKVVMEADPVGYKSIIIDDLLNKFGEITFNLTPVSNKGVSGKTISISGTAIAQPLVTKFVDKKKVKIDPATQAWADNPDPNEGPLKDLFDGDPETFYHMDWHNQTPFPHYIVIKLDKPAAAIAFDYICRNNGGKINPERMQVWASNSFDGTTFNPEAQGAVKAGEELVDLPTDQAATYESPIILLGGNYEYVWFQVLSGYNSDKFSALAELNVYTYTKQIYNPETGETTKE